MDNTFNAEGVSSTPTTSGNTPFFSVSGRKLSSIPIQYSPPSTFESPEGKYHSVTWSRFMDMEILSDIISSTLCPECKIRKLELKEVMIKKQGYASSLVALCDCGYSIEYYTSTKISNGSFEVNKRFSYAMRSCAVDYSGMTCFSL